MWRSRLPISDQGASRPELWLLRRDYGKTDVRKQAERLQRLLHQYRTARDAAAGVSMPLTATPPTAMAVLDKMGSSYHQTVVPVGLDDAHLVGISSGNGQFAGSAPLQQAVQLPNGEQMHQCEHWVPNGGVRGVTSAVGPSNAVMTGSWPPPRGGLGQWHAEQGERLQRWLCGASADPSLCLYGQPPLFGEEQLPPLSAEELLQNQNLQSCWFPGTSSLTYVSTSFWYR